MGQESASVLACPVEGVRSLACLLAEFEIPLLTARIRTRPALVVTEIQPLNGRHRTRFAEARAGGLPMSVRPDMVVISDRAELIARDAAFALIELALDGVAMCTLSQLLTSPPGREPSPASSVEDHLVRALAHSTRPERLKRGIDVLLGGLALLLALPVFALIAIAIRIDSPGSVFFTQERLGQWERPFRCWKFRTMRQDAEQAGGPVWARRDDPRITRVGRFLRRSRLDELPQLINVVRGDMSLVGPRPIRRHFADRIGPHVPFYSLRFLERPGLTGLAQVKYNYCSTLAEQIHKFRYDLDYARDRSLWLDLNIMLMTAWVVVRMRGT